MELKENHLKILLILLPVVLYISSFSFWSGYLSNLNIEYFNFNLDPNLIIQAYLEPSDKLISQLVSLVSTIFVTVVIIYPMAKNRNENIFIRLISILLAPFLFLGAVYLTFFPILQFYWNSLFKYWWAIPILFAFEPIIDLLTSRYQGKKTSEILVEHKEDSLQIFQFFTLFVPSLALVIIPGIFYYYGATNFREKTEWTIYKDKCIISFQDASNAYCNEYSETDKTISKTYTIINKNDLKDKISTKNLGRLTVKD
jgi:hypothetical protein